MFGDQGPRNDKHLPRSKRAFPQYFWPDLQTGSAMVTEARPRARRAGTFMAASFSFELESGWGEAKRLVAAKMQNPCRFRATSTNGLGRREMPVRDDEVNTKR